MNTMSKYCISAFMGVVAFMIVPIVLVLIMGIFEEQILDVMVHYGMKTRTHPKDTGLLPHTVLIVFGYMFYWPVLLLIGAMCGVCCYALSRIVFLYGRFSLLSILE